MAIDTQTINEKLYVGSFLRSRAAQNLAERTLQQYGESVSQFAAYLVKMGMPTTPEAISREHVESFVTHLLARWKPLTAATRYRGGPSTIFQVAGGGGRDQGVADGRYEAAQSA